MLKPGAKHAPQSTSPPPQLLDGADSPISQEVCLWAEGTSFKEKGIFLTFPATTADVQGALTLGSFHFLKFLLL